MQILVIFIVVCVVCVLIAPLWPLFVILAVLAAAYQVYAALYFRGRKFTAIKDRVQKHIQDCNELNQHIEKLKGASLVSNRTDYGQAKYHDKSKWKVKRTALKSQQYAPYIHDCSRTVCDNARKQPFKYICKYFGIKADEETLGKFESILNNFSAVEDGKEALKAEHETIMADVSGEVPFLIRKLKAKQLEEQLGFEPVDFSTLYFPKYIFKYVSPGGNAGTEYDVVMDIENLNKFILYLSENVKFQKSAAGQRALMTSKLRQKIKERDNFTCTACGVSLEQEPHLLLEIDHIIPVSKGGLTTEDNLQTLCWRCNRSKSNKITA